MTKFQTVKEYIFSKSDMDYVGICPASALENEPKGHRPTDLLPNAKSIIVYARRLIDGSVQAMFRNFEDGTALAVGSYSAHSFVLSVNHLCMKESYELAQHLEKTYGAFAMPVTNNVLQAVQPEGNFVPFFADPYKAGLPIDVYKAAVAAGIGELAWNHRVVTPDNGPRIYISALITDMEFEEYDKPYSGEKLCDPAKCHVCSDMCPMHALDANEGEEIEVAGKKCKLGKLDVNGCSVACFGFRKQFNGRSRVNIEEDHPSDETLAAGIKKYLEVPGIATLDHLSMFYCDKCMLYCPIGNWDEKYRGHKLTNK